MKKINIKGVSKIYLLAALENAAPKGLGFYSSGYLSSGDILLKGIGDLRFNYVEGKCLCVDISGDVLDPTLYDKECGDGAAYNAIKHLLI